MVEHSDDDSPTYVTYNLQFVPVDLLIHAHKSGTKNSDFPDSIFLTLMGGGLAESYRTFFKRPFLHNMLGWLTLLDLVCALC